MSDGPEMFSCHVTHDLPEAMGLAGFMLCAARTAPSASEFPGVVLSLNGSVSAGMGFAQEPDGVMAIVEPVFTSLLSSDDREQVFQRMLHESCEEGLRRGCRVLRFLESRELQTGDSAVARVLSRTGFVLRAKTIRWICDRDTLAAACFSEASSKDSQLTILPLHDIGADDDVQRKHALLELVRAVLRQSDDLSELEPPRAEMLIAQWQSRKASALVAVLDQRFAGLCVFSEELTEAAGKTSSWLQVLYIGVRPEFRSQGIASHMLVHLAVCAGSSPSAREFPCRISVLADSRNLPAVRLYERCGFTAESAHHLWCRDSSGTNAKSLRKCEGS